MHLWMGSKTIGSVLTQRPQGFPGSSQAWPIAVASEVGKGIFWLKARLILSQYALALLYQF